MALGALLLENLLAFRDVALYNVDDGSAAKGMRGCSVTSRKTLTATHDGTYGRDTHNKIRCVGGEERTENRFCSCGRERYGMVQHMVVSEWVSVCE